ncbi:hypothetical protein IU470_31465 [Nocardia abscessus]|uniref:Transposase n=1 Tax=Nocardia abscessus TaxID=120957 RepID=A0ABS0CGY3_9NOCA|nr:hypothetical protein [Nocardia abscessus]MBF6229594.1 hypothetical protein [Nocardia abscessus]
MSHVRIPILHDSIQPTRPHDRRRRGSRFRYAIAGEAVDVYRNKKALAQLRQETYAATALEQQMPIPGEIEHVVAELNTALAAAAIAGLALRPDQEISLHRTLSALKRKILDLVVSSAGAHGEIANMFEAGTTGNRRRKRSHRIAIDVGSLHQESKRRSALSFRPPP